MTSDALTLFPPTRAAALERLHSFVPEAGATYAARRNFDSGAAPEGGVSRLSPWLRARALTGTEVLQAVLVQHSPQEAEKFIQEVYWRDYWKGWLQLRPGIWQAYRAGLSAAHDRVQTEAGLRRAWEEACLGRTGIACFDHWAQELARTGYLHNHARMWFASIWIFTLRLPWALGADFFLRHLLDGDPASNTLSWRWVAGLQTQGKHYVARASNIARFTGGRFNPVGALNENPAPLNGPPHPEPMAPPKGAAPDPSLPSALLVTCDDMQPAFALQGAEPRAIATLNSRAAVSPWHSAPHVAAFTDALLRDSASQFNAPATHLNDAAGLTAWAAANGARQIITPFTPTGPAAAQLASIAPKLEAEGIRLVQVLRPEDAAAWPHATHGFFRFRKQIPSLLANISTARAA